MIFKPWDVRNVGNSLSVTDIFVYDRFYQRWEDCFRFSIWSWGLFELANQK